MDRSKIHTLFPYVFSTYVFVSRFTQQVCPTYGLVYVLTKYGHVKVCDVESAQHLCSARASPLTIFTAVPDMEGKKVIGIDRTGKVWYEVCFELFILKSTFPCGRKVMLWKLHPNQ